MFSYKHIGMCVVFVALCGITEVKASGMDNSYQSDSSFSASTSPTKNDGVFSQGTSPVNTLKKPAPFVSVAKTDTDSKGIEAGLSAKRKKALELTCGGDEEPFLKVNTLRRVAPDLSFQESGSLIKLAARLYDKIWSSK